jgi:hypothetical protein
MASERQIVENRRNARKSTGPRSEPGKKRAGQNAFRHGLTVHVTSVEFERQLKVLARRIAGETEDKMTLEHARMAAEAELELARVRQVKTALIERIMAFGGFEPRRTSLLTWPRFAGSSRWMTISRAVARGGSGRSDP